MLKYTLSKRAISFPLQKYIHSYGVFAIMNYYQSMRTKYLFLYIILHLNFYMFLIILL